MKLYLEEFPEYLKIESNKLNLLAIKELLFNMEKKKLSYTTKQQHIFEEEIFNKMWSLYYNSLKYYDVNYNRKSDIKKYFQYMLESELNKIEINFFALFCPGYTENGYKNRLGHTTVWKLEELRNITNFYKNNNIDNNMICCYSDVFLENTNNLKNVNWKKEMEYNRRLFHLEGEKYFESNNIINASSLPIFSTKKDIEGYINDTIINSMRKKTYNAFMIANERFYKKMGFTKEEMKYRNDKLITMYKMLSNYLNETENTIFLPMENMYERENIFSENKTCTMYLRLKR